MTPEELQLRELRHPFYSAIRGAVINEINWCHENDNYGNHMDFRINEIHGHVNWYFRNIERGRFDGNVCVVFRQYPNAPQIPDGFRVHPIHGDWIIASSEIHDVEGAKAWATEKIQSIRQ